MSIASKIWVIVDHDGRVIHHTTDESQLSFMMPYVDKAAEAGDCWKLLEFDFSREIQCSNSHKVKVLRR